MFNPRALSQAGRLLTDLQMQPRTVGSQGPQGQPSDKECEDRTELGRGRRWAAAETQQGLLAWQVQKLGRLFRVSLRWGQKLALSTSSQISQWTQAALGRDYDLGHGTLIQSGQFLKRAASRQHSQQLRK